MKIKDLIQGVAVAGLGYGAAVALNPQVPPPRVPLPAAERLAPMVPDSVTGFRPGQLEVTAFLLFIASEAIGMSKLRDNSVLQLILHLAQELFPYEVKRKEPPSRANRPRVTRDSHGRYRREEE